MKPRLLLICCALAGCAPAVPPDAYRNELAKAPVEPLLAGTSNMLGAPHFKNQHSTISTRHSTQRHLTTRNLEQKRTKETKEAEQANTAPSVMPGSVPSFVALVTFCSKQFQSGAVLAAADGLPECSWT